MEVVCVCIPGEQDVSTHVAPPSHAVARCMYCSSVSCVCLHVRHATNLTMDPAGSSQHAKVTVAKHQATFVEHVMRLAGSREVGEGILYGLRAPVRQIIRTTYKPTADANNMTRPAVIACLYNHKLAGSS